MKDFQDHFHRGVQAASADSEIQQRLSAHWMHISQYFDTVEMLKAYYKKFLTLRVGRGLPKLVDENIVTLVICAEFARMQGGGSSGGELSKEATQAVEKAVKAAESFKETASELKTKVGELKSEVNNLKTELKELKSKIGSGKNCDYCGKPGHTAKFCHARINDEEKAKKADADV